jgi:hypothetical protein
LKKQRLEPIFFASWAQGLKPGGFQAMGQLDGCNVYSPTTARYTLHGVAAQVEFEKAAKFETSFFITS